jgi:hypothetical protein
MPQPDLVPPEGQPEGETLAHFAVVLAAHRGQLAALDGKVEDLVESVRTLAEGGPKGPPMIAWHDLDDQEAAAIRADLAKWADEVLFTAYPSARDRIRECWLSHPDAVTEVSLIWLEYRRIYRAAHPPLADSLVFFDRWLPGVLRRVRQITDKCTGIDGCIRIRPG